MERDLRQGWRHPRHARDWWRTFENYVFPRIGRRPVSEVAAADVLEILEPIWHTKPETAAVAPAHPRRAGVRRRAGASRR